MMRWLVALLFALVAAATSSNPAFGKPADEADFRRWLTEYLDYEYHESAEPPFDPADKKYWRYGYVMVDLNGDGKREAIVHVVGPGCGTGGCGLEVFARRDVGWLPIGSASGWAPIKILESKSHGWANLGICERGGGITIPYEAIVRFDGKYYSGAVDKAIPDGLRGKVIISDPSIPLFGNRAERGPPMSDLFGPHEFRGPSPARC